MAKSIFLDKAFIPDDVMLIDALKENKKQWDDFLHHIVSSYPDVTTEWKFYGKAMGWAFVVSSKKKKLVFLTPAVPCFTVSFIFNEQAREMSKLEGFTEEVMQNIESGKTNPAGHSFDIPIDKMENMEIAFKLLRIKSKA